MGFVLVVDDQEENRDMLSRRLERKGYDTLIAENGLDALALIEKEEIDIVLLDIRMPGLDGNEVLERIRAKYSPTDLPVIMVTAEADSASEVKSLGLGADDYVTKPIDFQILLARLKNKLSISKLVKEQTQNKAVTKPEVFTEANIKALIEEGESDKLEFKSTLRWNIFAGKIGKEIEIAWLKTIVAFLNSNGGILLVGVKDDGDINGLSMDKFQNEDKLLLYVNNIISDRIGVEYIGHIFYNLVLMGEEKILRIECTPINEAIFLKGEKEEEFYARFGPSSRKLSTKEVLAYLKNR